MNRLLIEEYLILLGIKQIDSCTSKDLRNYISVTQHKLNKLLTDLQTRNYIFSSSKKPIKVFKHYKSLNKDYETLIWYNIFELTNKGLSILKAFTIPLKQLLEYNIPLFPSLMIPTLSTKEEKLIE